MTLRDEEEKGFFYFTIGVLKAKVSRKAKIATLEEEIARIEKLS